MLTGERWYGAGQVFKHLSAEGMPRVEAFLTKRLPEALSFRKK